MLEVMIVRSVLIFDHFHYSAGNGIRSKKIGCECSVSEIFEYSYEYYSTPRFIKQPRVLGLLIGT